MFTGIIKGLSIVRKIQKSGTNIDFWLEGEFEEPINIDQSIAHDGVCLTVTAMGDAPSGKTSYSVTAVEETLEKTNLGQWTEGKKVNTELCMRVGDRLDGHFVQGHVDAVGIVKSVEERDGSWMYHFTFDSRFAPLLVDKGSITINGVSLTVVKALENSFSVTIIPYTHEHTNFHQLREGDQVNLEFDILGKYIQRIMSVRNG
ncbi:MAG: riboflavin synthase [Bacteroidetes bacterium]|nr:riboflavin synthase [Bacteroidota bacterium]